MTTKATKPKRERAKHQVWVTFTVFVKRDGEKHPWYKHGRGPTISTEGTSHDKAMYLGERELAKLMAQRFDLVKP